MKTFIVRVPSGGGGGEVLSSGNFSNKYQKLEEEGEIRFPAHRLLFKQHLLESPAALWTKLKLGLLTSRDAQPLFSK